MGPWDQLWENDMALLRGTHHDGVTMAYYTMGAFVFLGGLAHAWTTNVRTDIAGYQGLNHDGWRAP